MLGCRISEGIGGLCALEEVMSPQIPKQNSTIVQKRCFVSLLLIKISHHSDPIFKPIGSVILLQSIRVGLWVTTNRSLAIVKFSYVSLSKYLSHFGHLRKQSRERESMTPKIAPRYRLPQFYSEDLTLPNVKLKLMQALTPF